MRRVCFALILCALTLSGLACAKHHEYSSMDEVFIHYDIDKNGIITKEEYVSQWQDKVKGEAAWKKLDKAGNGSLTRPQANNIPINVWSDLEQDNLH